jgi:hypothetical protein
MERQNLEVTLSGRSSLTPYNNLRSNWEKELCTELCTGEDKYLVWWIIRLWRLNEVRRNTERI